MGGRSGGGGGFWRGGGGREVFLGDIWTRRNGMDRSFLLFNDTRVDILGGGPRILLRYWEGTGRMISHRFMFEAEGALWLDKIQTFSPSSGWIGLFACVA